jgi:putative ABC transport system permease protein
MRLSTFQQRSLRPHLWLIRFIGVIVPRRLRADWKQEWEAELQHREALLAEWERLKWQNKLNLLWRSTSAFWDALWLQPQRLEDEMFQDLRYGARMLAQNPGFTLISILTLSLAIGANTAIFSLGNSLLMRPLPEIEQPDQLVAAYTSDFSGSRYGGSSYPDFADFRAQCPAFYGLAAYVDSVPINLGGGGEAQRIQCALVTGNYFQLLGAKMIQGRALLPEDDQNFGDHPVVVISYELWQRRFGADSNLIGQSINLNGRGFKVVGVAAPGFKGVRLEAAPEVWAPLKEVSQLSPAFGPDRFTRRGARWLRIVGRLKRGATLSEAQAQLDTTMAQLAQAYPRTNLGILQQPMEPRPVTAVAANQAAVWPGGRATTKRITQLLFGAAGLVLLISCANVAGVLLARARRRQKEIAVRQALGASRGRIARQMLTESLLLSALGGAGSLALALWLSDLLPSLNLFSSFASLRLSLDLRVLSFALGLTALTGLLFGLAPAVQAARLNLVSAMKEAKWLNSRGPRRFGLHNLLVVSQVALSLVLLIGAVLLLRSLRQAYATELGFNVENVLLASVDLAPQGYSEAQGRSFFQQLRERTSVLPGVRSLSLASFVPVSDNSNRIGVNAEGYTPREGEDLELNLNVVDRDYFQTLGIPLLLGRDFTPQDSATAPKVVIINEALANRFWPGQSPLGKYLKLQGEQGPPPEIIGVVKTIKYRDLREEDLPYLYLPLAQQYQPKLTLLVRTTGASTMLIPALRAGVRALDQDIPLFDVKTLAEQLSETLAPQRTNAALVGAFGLLALLLAALGVYGLMSYAVTERMHEIGIRLALGAQKRDVLTQVVRQGMSQVALGVAIGLAAALSLTRAVESLLFGVRPTDPLTFVGVVLLLISVALLACYVPARRATKVDPLRALRHE